MKFLLLYFSIFSAHADFGPIDDARIERLTSIRSKYHRDPPRTQAIWDRQAEAWRGCIAPQRYIGYNGGTLTFYKAGCTYIISNRIQTKTCLRPKPASCTTIKMNEVKEVLEKEIIRSFGDIKACLKLVELTLFPSQKSHSPSTPRKSNGIQ